MAAFKASFMLLIWLNENVLFSRQESFAGWAKVRFMRV